MVVACPSGWLRAALLAAALAAVAACGGKDKGATTTPTAGGGSDPAGMQDDAPIGGDAVGPATGGGEQATGGGEQATGGGEQAAGGGDPAGAGEQATGEAAPPEPPAKPKFTPPNLDPDPEVARRGVEGHLQTARDALARDKPDADLALKAAKAALEIDGTSGDATVLLALAYFHKGLFDTAETILDLAADQRESMRRHAGLFFVKGLIYDRANKPASAFVAYQKAVELDGEHGSALVNLGVHQLRNKLFEKAIATYEKVSRKAEFDRPAVWSALGAAYRGRSGDFEAGSDPRNELLLKARGAFERAVERDRAYGPAYYNLGLLYLDADPFPADGGPLDNLERLQKARAYFEEYKNLPGVDIELYDERIKNVTKLIKREEKKRKKKEKEKVEEAAPAPPPEGGS